MFERRYFWINVSRGIVSFLVFIKRDDAVDGKLELGGIKHVSCVYDFLYVHASGGRRGRDRMVVGFTTTFAISAYHH